MSSATGEGNKLHLLLQVIDNDVRIKTGRLGAKFPPKRIKVEGGNDAAAASVASCEQPRFPATECACSHTPALAFQMPPPAPQQNRQQQQHRALMLPATLKLQQPLRTGGGTAVSTPPGGHFDESRATWDRQVQQLAARPGGGCVLPGAFMPTTTPRAVAPSGASSASNYLGLVTALSAGQLLSLQKQRQLPATAVGECVSSNPAPAGRGDVAYRTATAAKKEAPCSASNSNHAHHASTTVPTKITSAIRSTPSPPALVDFHLSGARGSPTAAPNAIRTAPCDNYNYRLEDYALKFKAVFRSKANAVHNTPGAQIKKFQFIKEAYKEVVGREKDIRGGRKTKFDQMVEQCFHEVTCIPKRTLKRKKQTSLRVVGPLPSEALSFQPVTVATTAALQSATTHITCMKQAVF
jgi:hypothetical protein